MAGVQVGPEFDFRICAHGIVATTDIEPVQHAFVAPPGCPPREKKVVHATGQLVAVIARKRQEYWQSRSYRDQESNGSAFFVTLSKDPCRCSAIRFVRIDLVLSETACLALERLKRLQRNHARKREAG